MISDRMLKALNDHLNIEFQSAYYYLAMSASFLREDFNGFAQWMRAQHSEEMVHAMKFYDFIDDRDGAIELQALQGEQSEWDSPLHVFESALEHERMVTSKIYDLVDLSLEVRDHATNTFLQWFVTEQVEEEATASDIIQQLKLIGNDGNGLFMLDRELGQRSGIEAEDEAGAPPA